MQCKITPHFPSGDVQLDYYTITIIYQRSTVSSRALTEILQEPKAAFRPESSIQFILLNIYHVSCTDCESLIVIYARSASHPVGFQCEIVILRLGGRRVKIKNKDKHPVWFGHPSRVTCVCYSIRHVRVGTSASSNRGF
ncbi:hypothetical protein ACOSQ3_000355 [Xanthoceras sorbifolium]